MNTFLTTLQAFSSMSQTTVSLMLVQYGIRNNIRWEMIIAQCSLVIIAQFHSEQLEEHFKIILVNCKEPRGSSTPFDYNETNLNDSLINNLS